ncbi:hypothetical protein J4225_00020 [Candidatus Pacearchaeota archaeon]|nr:hypothetical protein [Candidatus Pacearchaeota archaeon]
MIEVQISYDPKIVGYPFLKIIYDDFGLNAPTPEEMMKHRDKIKLPSGKETEIGWESFAPLSKEKAKKLVNLLLDSSLLGVNNIEVRELRGVGKD